MGTLLDLASLVVVPSGYKAGTVYSVVPTDGAGDLAFTRSLDTATRVGPDGLIEKVRTNLILQSQTLDNASWNKTTDGQVTITANAAAAPDGTTTAEKMIPSAIAGFHCVAQTITFSAGEVTISVFAKAAENSFLQIFDSLTTDFANFNLTTGAVGSTDAYVASIQSAGNGWFRCTATKVVPSGSFVLRYGVVTTATAVRGQSFTGNGTDGLLIWGAQAETGVATPYIPTTTAAVSVGMLANVPRLDYLNSTCPKLLLEPQRINLQLNSEDFSQANWNKTNTTIVVNQLASPDGFVNSDKLNETAVNNIHQLESTRSVVAATQYTMSVFAKKAERSIVRVYEDTTNNGSYFDLNNGTLLTQTGPTVSSKIENYGNGWYRCSVTYTETNTSGRYRILVTNADNVTSYLGVAGNGIYIYGAQYEAGAYATSYIPTLGAAVTRSADAASKTGISALIGQTEGTLFVDFIASAQNADGVAFSAISIFGNATDNFQVYALGTTLYWYSRNSVGLLLDQTANQTLVAGQRYKIAYAYKSGDWALYINGVQKRTNTAAAVPAVSQFNLSSTSFGAAAATVKNEFAQALLFKTRLTNALLAQLTTI